jgi:two-component system chemotaxis sensor kinase CheA
MTKDEEFQKRLVATFKIEAEEHIASISAGLIELEKQPPPEIQMEIVEVIYRDAHSLKGAARSVNFSGVEQVCQAMEGLFAEFKKGKMILFSSLFDLLNDATGIVSKLISTPDTTLTSEDLSEVEAIQGKLIEAVKAGLPASTSGRSASVPQSVQHLETETPPECAISPQSESSSEPRHASLPEKIYTGSETIRIPAARLDSLLLKAEELVSAKLAARQHANLARELKTCLDSWKDQWLKLSSESLKSAPQELLELNRTFFRSFESRLLGLKKTTDEDSRSIGGMVDNLLADVKGVMMYPFSSLLDTFPRLVRDLSREQGKEIELTMQGVEIEIDRRILQEIKDPLNHLIRNCIDHGMETKVARKQKQKPEKGNIQITVTQRDSGKIEIAVADDGAGIDLDKVVLSAVKAGIITEADSTGLSREEALALIFESGISTSSIITTVSGRGLGMAIVREKIEKLGGTIAIQTTPDKGTSFSILLPLSLATFRGILIQSGGQIFAVPTMKVEMVQKLPCSEVRTVENRETVTLGGRAVSLVRLDQLLELPLKPAEDDDLFLTVMVLSTGDKQLAFVIDEMLYEDEILLKSLGGQLSRVRNIAGATLLGSGKVIPILNAHDLVKSALKLSTGGARIASIEKRHTKAKRQSVLVAEDSITARTLFVNILESAGFQVTTAVDGVDAFNKLCEAEFDLVVSDIEMPGMNGFELTEKIRADKRLTEIPIVIVTGLESPEDKKRGIEVGANAYLVKSSFDQSNLVEVVRRLI